jgi:hypothetical protein
MSLSVVTFMRPTKGDTQDDNLDRWIETNETELVYSRIVYADEQYTCKRRSLSFKSY